MEIQGSCADGFGAVREVFERNFAERGELDAAVHATVGGETVVDLWGGDRWTEDTLVHVWSSTKGAVALCAHILAHRNDLDFDKPVAHYWPEFGKNGKEGILVRHLLAHQAGLAAVREPLPQAAFYDWDLMTSTLAAAEPLWEPGTRHGYHALTFGFLVGELIRRVDGRSLDRFFKESIAEPEALDFHIGLPEELEDRVLPTIPADFTVPGTPVPSVFVAAMTDPASLQGLMLGNTGGYMNPGESDTRAAHAAVIGATGGYTNARGLSGLYRPLANGGGPLVDEHQVERMAAVASASSVDAVLLVPSRFSLGFVKAADNHYLPAGDKGGVLLSEDAFGHVGFGGSIGFADARARLSFGYVMTKQGPGTGLDDRGQALVDAVYAALGYTRPDSGGIWHQRNS